MQIKYLKLNKIIENDSKLLMQNKNNSNFKRNEM